MNDFIQTKPKKKPNFPLTFEERQQIESLWKQGLSGCEISRRINRSSNCVSTEIRIHSVDGKYSAKQSQNQADIAKEKRYQELSERNKKIYTEPSNYKQRIENLEMQIEILHDTIQEILKK